MKWTREAPAKVNLTLDILGLRPDGYHEMRMVMQTVSLCDTVTVEETAEGFSLHTNGDFIPAGKKTLEQRAAEAFFTTAGQRMPGLSVTLEKRTPAYAGLGGGSADVAALLHILRDHWCPEMPGELLERIGGTVGSDMPFCVRGGTALAEGRGEVLTDLPELPDCTLVICKPDLGIPTAELFARVRGRSCAAGQTPAVWWRPCRQWTWRAWRPAWGTSLKRCCRSPMERYPSSKSG